MASKYRALIRRNSDGVERWSEWFDFYGDEPEKLLLFSWRENNFSCDCNRFLEFERAGGVEPDDDDQPCGHILYDVIRFENDDGEVLVEDGTPRWERNAHV